MKNRKKLKTHDDHINYPEIRIPMRLINENIVNECIE